MMTCRYLQKVFKWIRLQLGDQGETQVKSDEFSEPNQMEVEVKSFLLMYIIYCIYDKQSMTLSSLVRTRRVFLIQKPKHDVFRFWNKKLRGCGPN